MAREADSGPLDAREVEVAAAEGEPRAIVMWEGAIAACAVGVDNLVMSFYPSTVVIGGGIGLGRRPSSAPSATRCCAGPNTTRPT